MFSITSASWSSDMVLAISSELLAGLPFASMTASSLISMAVISIRLLLMPCP